MQKSPRRNKTYTVQPYTFQISLILLAAFMSLSIINYNTVKQSIEKEIMSSSLPLLRDHIYSEIQNDFDLSPHRASTMTADIFLMEWAASGGQDAGKVTEYLYSIQEGSVFEEY